MNLQSQTRQRGARPALTDYAPFPPRKLPSDGRLTRPPKPTLSGAQALHPRTASAPSLRTCAATPRIKGHGQCLRCLREHTGGRDQDTALPGRHQTQYDRPPARSRDQVFSRSPRPIRAAQFPSSRLALEYPRFNVRQVSERVIACHLRARHN